MIHSGLQPDERSRELSYLTPPRETGRGPIRFLRQIWDNVINGRSSQGAVRSLHHELASICSSLSDETTHEGVILTNEKKYYIPSEHIKKLEKFPCSGGLSDVWKCSMSAQGETRIVAVKAIRIYSGDQEILRKTTKKIRREAGVWIHLSHNHILPFEGLTDGFGPLPAVVSAWMENLSLSDYLKWKHVELSDSRKSELIQHVAAGLSHLHGKNIVHGDLTGTNILVDGPGNLYLADFSLSMILAKVENMSFNSKSPRNSRWMAPEFVMLKAKDREGMLQVLHEKPTKAGDIYSFGCVMLQILSGKEPYPRMIGVMPVISAIAKKRGPFDGVEINMNEAYRQLSSRCLSRDPDRRPEIVDIMSVVGLTGTVSSGKTSRRVFTQILKLKRGYI